MKFPVQFIDKDFGVCKILFSDDEKPENIYLFASHTFSPALPEYVFYFLDQIKKTGYSIIFISSSVICEQDVFALSRFCHKVIEKDNKGTDFGAWCAVLRHLDYGKGFKRIYLCNDSVFGPFFPLTQLHEKFETLSDQVMGITDSHQGIGYHIQSYFVGLKTEALELAEWTRFWKDMTFLQDKGKVIEFYEIGLSQMLINAGMKCFIWTDWSNKMSFRDILSKVSESENLRSRWLNRMLYDKKKIIFDINPCSFLWDQLIIDCRNPFIKREIFIYQNLFEECEVNDKWESILKNRFDYPTRQIYRFLLDYFLFRTLPLKLREFNDFRIEIVRSSGLLRLTDQKGKRNPLLFNELDNLLSTKKQSEGLEEVFPEQQLSELEVSFMKLQLSFAENRTVPFTLIYLDSGIIEFKQEQLTRLKVVLKRTKNPIIVIPDQGTRAIVSSLLSIKFEGLILENQFYFPLENRTIISAFLLLANPIAGSPSSLFQRPSIANVIADALAGSNTFGFLGSSANLNDANPVEYSDFDINIYKSREEYLEYVNIRNKYQWLYESTPWWYKKLGQLIKLFTGRKKLRIEFIDKERRTMYRPLAADLTHWYYLQYEVLPGWYKQIGRKLIQPK